MTTTQRRERVDALDALRGVLAISVMVYHLLIWLYDVELDAVGSYAVYMFFVLSGFAMHWVNADLSLDGFPVRRYTVARVARILPLWWVAVLATAVQNHATVSLGAVVENLTLLSAITPTDALPIGGWSIEIEVVFYLLLPALLVAFRTRRALLVALVVALAVRWVYVDTTWAAGRSRPDTVAYFTFPTFAAFFLGGMLLAHARREVPAARSQLPAVGGLALVGVVFVASALSLRNVLAGPFALGLALISVAAVGLVSLAPNPASALWRTVQETLGAVSFATYLLHPLVFTGLQKFGLPAPATFVATIVVSVGLSWASYRWFEMPVGRMIRTRGAASRVASGAGG